MTFELLTNLDRAADRRFRAGSENERTAIAGRQPQQFAFGLRDSELLRSADDLF
jgi:hypothetical protein